MPTPGRDDPNPNDQTLWILPNDVVEVVIDYTTGNVNVGVATLWDPRVGGKNLGEGVGVGDAPLPPEQKQVVLMLLEDAVAAGLLPTGEIRRPI